MSSNGPSNSGPHASTSSAPHMTTPASYHPLPRPQPLPPLIRVDTQAIKQELHDALGENGLAYWKAVNGYLIGQLSRKELETMIRGWLKGDKLHLHNKLLVSLLHNASTPSQAPPATIRKRKRVPPHDPEFDMDETTIEPKQRISHWISALTARDRGRVRRVVGLGMKVAEEGSGEAGGKGEGEGEEEEEDWEIKRKKMSSYWPGVSSSSLGIFPSTGNIPFGSGEIAEISLDVHLPPLALPDRSLPSSHQAAARLQAIAKANDLSLADPTSGEIGEFLSLGLDSHVSEILHSLVHLTGRERPGTETIRVPIGREGFDEDEHGIPQSNGYAHDAAGEGQGNRHQGERAAVSHADPALPRPSVDTLQHLFALNPAVHPTQSVALHQLTTGYTAGQIQAHQSIPMSSASTLSAGQGQHAHAGMFSRPASPVGIRAKNLVNGIVNGNSDGPSSRSNDLHSHSIDHAASSLPSGPIIPLSSQNTSTGHIGTSSQHFNLPSSLLRGMCGPAFLSHRAEAVGKMLLDSGLLKGDKDDEQEKEGGKGKKKKHGLHWKYEDPALILRDVLG